MNSISHFKRINIAGSYSGEGIRRLVAAAYYLVEQNFEELNTTPDFSLITVWIIPFTTTSCTDFLFVLHFNEEDCVASYLFEFIDEELTEFSVRFMNYFSRENWETAFTLNPGTPMLIHQDGSMHPSEIH